MYILWHVRKLLSLPHSARSSTSLSAKIVSNRNEGGKDNVDGCRYVAIQCPPYIRSAHCSLDLHLCFCQCQQVALLVDSVVRRRKGRRRRRRCLFPIRACVFSPASRRRFHSLFVRCRRRSSIQSNSEIMPYAGRGVKRRLKAFLRKNSKLKGKCFPLNCI